MSNPLQVNIDQMDLSPEAKLVITELQERIQYLEGFESKANQLEQQYRTLHQDYLVAQAAADYYKRIHEESLENDDEGYEELYNEELRKRKQHEDTISRLENTLKCLQLTQATTTHNFEALQAKLSFIMQNMDKDKETLMNRIRRLQTQQEDTRQNRHLSTSSSIAIPTRESDYRDSMYSESSFTPSSNGSYYRNRRPPRPSMHIDSRRHTIYMNDDKQIIDEWRSVSKSILEYLGEQYISKARSYIISEISHLTYISINTQQVSWDEKSTQCYLCHKHFSCLIRRHHCRYCGNAFCYSCAPRKVAICNTTQCEALKCCILCERMINSIIM